MSQVCYISERYSSIINHSPPRYPMCYSPEPCFPWEAPRYTWEEHIPSEIVIIAAAVVGVVLIALAGIIAMKEVYAEIKTREIVVLAHWLSLTGNINLDGMQISLEGLSKNFFFDDLANFLKTFVENENGQELQLSRKDIKVLEEALKNCSHSSAEECAQHISNQQLTFMATGWYEHAIGLGFFYNYLAIGNGGPRPEDCSTLEIFPVNPKLMTPEIVKQIRRRDRLPEDGKKFFYETLPSMLSGTKKLERDDLCISFRGIAPKPQKVGNCSLASKIPVIRFAWAMLLRNQENPPENLFEVARDESKSFTAWCKGQVFERAFNRLGAEKFKASGLARICLS